MYFRHHRHIIMAAGQHIRESMFLDSASRDTAEEFNCPQCKQLLRNAVQPSCGHWLCEECAKELFATESASRAIVEKYNCPQCKRLLRNAVQPSCGHWLCEECAKGLFATESPPTCPRPDCREELEGEDGMEYFPDRFVRKEILNLMVKCLGHDSGCSWTGKLKDYEGHFKQCSFVTKECQFCGHAVIIQEMTSHVATCPKAGKLCPLVGLGCTAGQMSAPQLEKHCVELITEHFECLSAAVKDLQVQVAKEQPHLRNIPEEDEGDDSAYGSSYKSSRQPPRGEGRGDYDSGYGSFSGRTRHRLVDTEEKDGGGPRSGTKLGKQRPMKLGLEVADPFSGLSDMSVAIESSREQIVRELLRSRDDELSALKASVTKLEKQLRAKNAELEDRDFRLSLIENSSFDGTMVWKIPLFEQRMADAKSGKYTSIISLPFYTGCYGYKMCLRLYILGDGKGTHMSLFLMNMCNDYDKLLRWPFIHQVVFKLINQCGGSDIVKTFDPNPSLTTSPIGFPRFVSHQELETGFLQEDTLFVAVSIPDFVKDPAPSLDPVGHAAQPVPITEDSVDGFVRMKSLYVPELLESSGKTGL